MTETVMRKYVYHPPTKPELDAIRKALDESGRTLTWLGKQLANRWYPDGVHRDTMSKIFKGDHPFPDPHGFTVAKAWRVLSYQPGPKPKADPIQAKAVPRMRGNGKHNIIRPERPKRIPKPVLTPEQILKARARHWDEMQAMKKARKLARGNWSGRQRDDD